MTEILTKQIASRRLPWAYLGVRSDYVLIIPLTDIICQLQRATGRLLAVRIFTIQNQAEV